MIILISGATHTGKTVLAQKLLEKYHWPYLSLDHLKMGLIRSGRTTLTVYDDEKMTDCLWPIVREMIKTAIENKQNLIVEGCYIPFSWRDDFSEAYLEHMRDCWLVMSPEYIRTHFDDIRKHACDVEARLDDSDLDAQVLIRENQEIGQQCRKFGCEMIWIDSEYAVHAERVCF